MPKIFVLRHQLAEQQKKLRQDDKGAGGEASNSPPLSPEEDSNKYEASPRGQSSNNVPPEVLPLRPLSGLVIQPIPAPSTATSAASSSVSIIPSTQPSASGKTLFLMYYYFKCNK